MNPRIAIIILNWNGKTDTLACLESLRKVRYTPFTTLVVDNGSRDDSVAAITKDYSEVKLIETGKNLGYAGGNNVGIAWALKESFELLFILNNDTVVDPDILDAFAQGFKERPKAGILGAKLINFQHPDKLDHLGGIWEPSKVSFKLVGLDEKAENYQEWLPLDYVCGAAMMVRREVFEKAGLFDPRFFLLWEEADLCFRARKQGFEVLSCPTAKLLHKGAASFVGGKPHTSYFYMRNRLLWMKKNLGGRKRLAGYCQVAFKTFRIFKHKQLLRLQLLGAKLFRTEKEVLKKQRAILKCEASLLGVRDYLLGRFGEASGPLFYKKK